MVKIKNRAALDKMETAGRLLAGVMAEMADHVEIGVSTLELDGLVEGKLRKVGLFPVCKGYGGYKYATCISLNDVVIHGVPSDKIVLKSGDFVKIDVAASYKHYCADMTRFFFVGKVSTVVKKLAAAAQWALDCAIEQIAPGKHLGDISALIQKEIEREGFGVVRTFAGHGIGRGLHEDPEVPNFGKPGEGPVLREGMVLAIEPMITEKGYEVKTLPDGWSVATVDGGLAAHVEDTVAVTKDGAQVLTRL